MADNRRTAEELRDLEYNYYIYFMIDPAEKDGKKIEQAIKKATSNTGGSVISRRFNELKNDALQVMCNDAVYDESAETYTPGAGGRAKELAAAKDLSLKKSIATINAQCLTRKTLLKSELLDICTAANKKCKLFTEAEFLSLLSADIKGLGVKIVDNTDSTYEFRKYEEIDNLLKPLQKESLYKYLGLEPTATAADLTAAVSNSESVASKTSDLKKKQSFDKLNVMCRTFLTSDAAKRKAYDYYFLTKDDIWSNFRQKKDSNLLTLPMSDYERYTKTAIDTLKCDIDEAEQFIAAGCKYFQMAIIGMEEGSNLELCPYEECGKLYIAGSKTCSHCGKPLEVVCWCCGGGMPFTRKSKTCPTCKSTFQGKAMFETRLRDVEKALRAPIPSETELQSALLNLKNAAPNYAVNKNGNAAKKIADCEKSVADILENIKKNDAAYRDALKQIQSLMAVKKYMQAKGDALNLRKKFGTYNAANTTALIGDIDKVIRQAQTFVDQAKAYKAKGDESMVLSCAVKALEICEDMVDAGQLIAPPKAPAAIRQKIQPNNTVRIEWDKSETQMTTYTVVKKVGSKPAGINDGTVLRSNLSINFFEDNNLVAGTPYYYGVFAERYGKTSGVVTCNMPAILYLDVAQIRQELSESAIIVKWDCPYNVKEIEVWKKEGPVAPTGIGDGVKVQTAGQDGFTDSDCKTQNSYLIVCIYEYNGVKKLSRGVQRTFKKYEMLKKLENPNILQKSTGEFCLTFSGAGNGKLRLLASKERIACDFDTAMQMSDYNNICKDCTELTYRVNAAHNPEFFIPEGQVFWVYPMVYNDQLFMLSKPFLLNNISGIRNVSFTEDSGTVTIKGVLPAGARNVIVKIGDTAFPQSVNDAGEKIVVSKERFTNEGGVLVHLKVNTVNYISLFTEIEKDGVKTVSKGVNVGDQPIDYRERVSVLYALDYKVSQKGSFTVTVKFSADDEVELPRLCLVKGLKPPMSKGEGELVETFEAFNLKKGFLSSKFTGKLTAKVPPCALSTKLALFLDDQSNNHVRLRQVKTL